MPEEKITLCGDNCLKCPRYNAHTYEELKYTAELWFKIGWRDRVVSADEIKCTGCSSHKSCTYGLVACTGKHGVQKCNQCEEFPCDKITDMLNRSKDYQKRCKEVCTAEEYRILKESFFNKEENLRK